MDNEKDLNSTKKSKKEKKKDDKPKVSLFKVLRYSIKITFSTIPFLYVITNIVAVIHGISHGFATFVMQQFYDSVEVAIRDSGAVGKAMLMIAALGGTYIAKESLNGIHNFMHSVNFDKLVGSTNSLIHKKMAKLSPEIFENVKFHDDINKASEGIWPIHQTLFITVTLVTFYVPYFTFMGYYLSSLKPQFIFAIVLVFIPVAIGQLFRTKIISKFEDKVAPIRREHGFYYDAIAGKGYMKETRILGGYGYFKKLFMDTMKRLNKQEWKSNSKINILEFILSCLSMGGYIGILYMLIDALLAGEITVGAFAAVFSSIGLLFAIVQEVIGMHIGSVAANMGRAANLIRFLELPERNGEDAEPDYSQGISAEHINFTYPGTDKLSIDDVTLEIKQGETVAIVGENGAGKTTLVRLLIGLYIPNEGEVTLNGMNTKKANHKSLFNNITGVFQHYQHYAMTLDENIKIADFYNDKDTNEILKISDVEMDEATFPNGLETMLSRDFEGVELSGGQWQRIAIARGFYKNHEVIVLDEPTAAIDPIEENKIYKKFMEIAENKTAIIVTHRLGSVKVADRVIVMDKGKIADIGTHEELLEKDGLYSTMFKAQAAWYN